MKSKFIFSLILLFVLFFGAASSAQALNLRNAFDFAGNGNNDPTDAMASAAGYDTSKTDILGIVSKVVNAILSILGVLFLLLTLYGGFTWMTARGNEQQVEKAMGILYMSIIGLLIILGAYAISYLVIARLSAWTLSAT